MLLVPFLLLLLVSHHFSDEIKQLILSHDIESQTTAQLLSIVDDFWQASVITAVIALVIALFSIFFMRVLFLRPINAITHVLKQIKENDGDISATLPEHTYDEISEMARSYNQFSDSLKKMISESRNRSVSVALSATRLQKVQDRCLESCQISAESSELSVSSEPAMPAFVELPVTKYSCEDKPAAVISCPNFKIEISESVSEAFLLKLIGVMKHA